MLIKTFDTKDTELIEKAKISITAKPNGDNNDVFVPYIDISTSEIRYLHFILQGDNWLFKNYDVKY